jgi:hypothetical protein
VPEREKREDILGGIGMPEYNILCFFIFDAAYYKNKIGRECKIQPADNFERVSQFQNCNAKMKEGGRGDATHFF